VFERGITRGQEESIPDRFSPFGHLIHHKREKDILSFFLRRLQSPKALLMIGEEEERALFDHP